MRLLSRIGRWARGHGRHLLKLDEQVSEAKILAAKALIHQTNARGVLADIREAEFKVFSQFGEDGILQYLTRRAGVTGAEERFVELGVETYTEATTRFLLVNDNWRGLIVDASRASMEAVKQQDIYWRHDLTAVAAFIDSDNVNGLIADAGFAGSIGVLGIDLDGNDYWIWKRIEVVDPVIVVVEYNSVFGCDRAVTVPYDPAFVRDAKHHSHLYWGASLKALDLLGREKGYALVGSNRAGNNAFFVRRDRLNGQPQLTAEQAYVESRFRESRDRRGELTYHAGGARLAEIAEMPVYDVERAATVKLDELVRRG